MPRKKPRPVNVYKFRCPHCKVGHLHPTKHLDKLLEFKCMSCESYCTPTYEKWKYEFGAPFHQPARMVGGQFSCPNCRKLRKRPVGKLWQENIVGESLYMKCYECDNTVTIRYEIKPGSVKFLGKELEHEDDPLILTGVITEYDRIDAESYVMEIEGREPRSYTRGDDGEMIPNPHKPVNLDTIFDRLKGKRIHLTVELLEE